MSSASGRVIGGRYRLAEALGRGGMGAVWRARDEVLARDVAVKELLFPPGMTRQDQEVMRGRTMREARTAARLSHPGVVRIFDVVEDEQRPWIVMELLPSARSLSEILADEGALSPQRAAEIGVDVLAGLAAAHSAGVLHRDVKPGNILIAKDGRAVLGDFGIAVAEEEPTLTRSGVLIGSPAYLSPEQARGKHLTPASDLWSLGATLYTIVEGRTPFHRDNVMATLTAIIVDAPDPPRRAGPLWPVIEGLLRKDPAGRLDTRAVAARLVEVADEPRAEAAASAPAATGDSEPAQRTAVLHKVPVGPAERGAAPAVEPPPFARPPQAEPSPAEPAGIEPPAAEPSEGERPGAEPPREEPPQAEPSGAERPAAEPSQAGPSGAESAAAGPPEDRSPSAAEPAPVPQDESPPGTERPAAESPAPAEEPAEAEKAAVSARERDEGDESDGDDHDDGVPGADGRTGGAASKESAADEAGAPSGRPPRPREPADDLRPPARPARRPAASAARGPRRSGTAASAGGTAGAGTAETGGVPADGSVAAADRREGGTGTAAPRVTGAEASARGGDPAADGPAGRPPEPPHGPARGHARRRRVVAALAALVLAGGAVALTVDILRTRETHRATTTGAHGAPRTGGASHGPARPTGGTRTPTATAAPHATTGPGSTVAPAGFRRYHDPTGFSIDVPDGWRISHGGHYVYVRDPGGGRYLLIDQTTDPKPDPLADWRDQDAYRRRNDTGYHRIALRTVPGYFEKSADLEFTEGDSGDRTHVLNRNILVNDHRAYALYWSTPESQWQASRHYFDVFAAGFHPAS